jgi:hypothetical protein
MCVQSPDYKRSIGYDFSVWENVTAAGTEVPRVRWLRVDMASSTPRSAPPEEILRSYEAWVDWRDNARKVWSVRLFPILHACMHACMHAIFCLFLSFICLIQSVAVSGHALSSARGPSPPIFHRCSAD